MPTHPLGPPTPWSPTPSGEDCPEGQRKTPDGRCVEETSELLRNRAALEQVQQTGLDLMNVPEPDLFRQTGIQAGMRSGKLPPPQTWEPEERDPGMEPQIGQQPGMRTGRTPPPEQARTTEPSVDPSAAAPVPVLDPERRRPLEPPPWDGPSIGPQPTPFSAPQVAYQNFRDSLAGDLSLSGKALDKVLGTADTLQRTIGNVVRRARGGDPITDEDARRITDLLRQAEEDFPKSAAAGAFLGSTTGILSDLAVFKGLASAGGARMTGPMGELLRTLGRWNQPTRGQALAVGAAEEIPIQAARMAAGNMPELEEAGFGAALGAAAGAALPGSRAFRAAEEAAEASSRAGRRMLLSTTPQVPDVVQRVEGAAEAAGRMEAEEAFSTVGRSGVRVTYKGQTSIDEFGEPVDLPMVEGTEEFAAGLPDVSIHRFEFQTPNNTGEVTAFVDQSRGHVDLDIPTLADAGDLGPRAMRQAARDMVKSLQEQGIEVRTIGGYRQTGAQPGREIEIPVERVVREAKVEITPQRLRDDPRAGYLLLPDADGIRAYARSAIQEVERTGWSVANITLPGTTRGGRQLGTSIRREFMSQGDLPEAAFNAKIKNDAWTKSAIRRGEYILREWDARVADVLKNSDQYGISSAEDVDVMLNTVLTAQGREPMLALPEPLRPIAMEMRDYLDTLSQKLIDDGVVQGPLAKTVEANKGIYLNRAYRVHQDPRWTRERIDPEIVNRAVAFIRSQDAYKDLTDEQINTVIDRLLKHEAEAPFYAARTLGKKDVSALRRRILDARPIRQLLGEVEQGRENFARSTLKLSNLIGNHNTLAEVKDAGLRQGWLSRRADFRPGHTEQLAGKESDVMFPLNDIFTTPQIARAFKDAVDPDIQHWVGPHIMKGIGAVKYGKTVLSIQTHVRNFISASGFAVANGHVFNGQMWRDMKYAMGSTGADLNWMGGRGRGMVDELQSSNVVERAVNGGVDVSNPDEMLTLMNRLQEMGVTFEAVRAGELGQTISDALKAEDPLEQFQGFFSGPMSRLSQRAQKLYQAEDDVWKIFSFLNEYRRYRKALPSSISNEEVERRVAGIIRNQIPTYSLVPRLTERFRRNPLVAPFASFTSEIIRTSSNILRQTAAEILSENPEIRKIGYQRAAGVLMAGAGITGVAQGSRMLVGMSTETEKDLREALPPWSKNGEIVWLGWDKENGTAQYIDASFSDPYNYLKRPMIALLNGQSWEDGLKEALGEALDPFLSEEIATGAIIDTFLQNRKASGSPIWNPTDTPGDIAWAMTKHLGDQLKPGTFNNLERIAKGYGWVKDENGREYDGHAEVIATVFGLRISTVDFRDMLFFRGLDLSDDLDLSRKRVTRAAYKEELDEGELEREFGKSTDARRRLLEDYSQAIHTARVAGLDDRAIREQMERAGLPSDLIRDLLRGQFRAYTPNVERSEDRNVRRRARDLRRLERGARGDLEVPGGVQNESTDSSTPPSDLPPPEPWSP